MPISRTKPPQPDLGIEVPRVTCAQHGLADIHYASRVLDLDFETVASKVLRFTKPGAEVPGLCWVFNIAVQADGAEAAYRFWPTELHVFRHATLLKQVQSKLSDSVIGSLLPGKDTFTAVEVESLLCCSSAHVLRLRDAGELNTNAAGRFTRKSLIEFLQSRLFGAE